MANIKIEFKGYITIDKDDIVIFNKEGDWLEDDTINAMSIKEVVDGLKNGTYTIELGACYDQALGGSEEYEFSIADL